MQLYNPLAQVGGFLQRIDYVRKYAFAAVCILKDATNGTFPIRHDLVSSVPSAIVCSTKKQSYTGLICCRGLFLFRGKDIPPIMKEECVDLDLYNWTKVDPLKDAVRLIIFPYPIQLSAYSKPDACLYRLPRLA